MRLLEEVHKRYGRTDWAGLLEPAKNVGGKRFSGIASTCFLVASEGDRLKTYKDTTAYFFDKSGAALKAGTQLKNPAYAETLALLAEGGADAFYKGKIAEAIVKTVRESGRQSRRSFAGRPSPTIASSNANGVLHLSCF